MKHSGISLSAINPAYLPEIERLLAEQQKAPAAQETEAKPTERRLRQEPKMNRLETDYGDVLHMRYGKDAVIAQSVRVRLANGAWYKPDFFIPSALLFIEVKGPKVFRGGIEFLKMAATAAPWAKFRMVWRVSGQWRFQDVLP